MIPEKATRSLNALLLAAAMSAAACGDGAPESDAFGNFEARETIISAETVGPLLVFHAREGEQLTAGEIVAVVDTSQLALQRAALYAQRKAAASRIDGVEAQVAVLEEQQRIAARERDRARHLVALEAAATSQVDELEDQIHVLARQIASVRSQTGTILSEMAAVDAQIAQIADQINRSVIVNPVDGTVLTSYAEPFEQAAPGKPLYKIGDLDTLYLRAYVSGGQLSALQLGRDVEVIVDAGSGELQALPGTVSWIASDAEFTPKLIQTREERVNLVYAVRVRVPNTGGILKIGMPGELRF